MNDGIFNNKKHISKYIVSNALRDFENSPQKQARAGIKNENVT